MDSRRSTAQGVSKTGLEKTTHKLSMEVAVLQFSLLDGSTHDQWLQQKREGAKMDEDSRLACEVLRSRKAGRVSLGLLHLSWHALAILCSTLAS